MRPSHLTALALCSGIGVCGFAAEAPMPLAPEVPSPTPLTPFETKLDQIQGLTTRVRESRNPAERQRLLAEQARAVQEALWLTRTAARPAPGRRARVGPPAMAPQPVWAHRERMRGAPTPATQWGPGQGRAKGPGRYEVLEGQIRDLEERVAAQQLILDEILRYREPIERLLGQQD
jgi:hypothetical protein